MDTLSFLLWLVIGVVAGWIASRILEVRSRRVSYGLLGNIIVGIIGSILGGYMLTWLGWTLNAGWLSLIAAVVGAVVLLFVVGLIVHTSRRGSIT